jgi:hypothetical protein
MIHRTGIDNVSRLTVRSFSFCAITLFLVTNVAAQAPEELNRRMATGQCYFDEVPECDFSKVCKGITEFYQNQSCQQQCQKQSEIQSRYNDFVRKCKNSRDTSDQKLHAPAPSAVVLPGQSNDIQNRIDAQTKKAAAAPAKIKTYKAQILQDETKAVNKRNEELEELRKNVAEQAKQDAERKAAVRAAIPKNDHPVIPADPEEPRCYTVDHSKPGCENIMDNTTCSPNDYCRYRPN